MFFFLAKSQTQPNPVKPGQTRPPQKTFWKLLFFSKQSQIFHGFCFAESRITVPLAKILPPPRRKSPTREYVPRAKHPNNHLTSPECMEFIREKDKDFLQGTLKKPKTSAEHQKALFNSLPQPYYLGSPGHFCGLCLSHFEDPDALKCEKWWVLCPNCKAQFHYDCIKTARKCACGQPVVVKRKPNNI